MAIISADTTEFLESLANAYAQVDSQSSYNWLVAVLLATLAAFISNLGTTLQKLSHLRSSKERVDKDGNVRDGCCSPLWLSGLALLILGSLADFTALRFGPQSLVAPLGSLTLVSNLIFAPLLLKEKIVPYDIAATAAIILGSSMCVSFGNHEDIIYPQSELFELFSRTAFIVYSSIVSVCILGLYITAKRLEFLEYYYREEYSRSIKIHRFVYPCMSGAVGAFSVLFAKCSVELLVDAANEHPNASGADVSMQVFSDWRTYFILAAMAMTIGFQIKWLNDGLRRFRSSYIVPVFTSFWMSLSVIAGLVFFREYEGMSNSDKGLFFLGLFITLCGVIALGSIHHLNQDNINIDEIGDDGKRFEVAYDSESGVDSVAEEIEEPSRPLIPTRSQQSLYRT